MQEIKNILDINMSLGCASKILAWASDFSTQNAHMYSSDFRTYI